MHDARDTGRARALPTTPDTSRRRLFATAAGALVVGATVATTAEAGGSADDAEIIRLCAEVDNCERQADAIYATEPDDSLAAAAVAPVMARHFALAQRIAGSRVHSPAGIFALARSLAISNGNGDSDFHPETDTLTGCLMTALLREACLLSGLPAPTKLAGRTSA